MSRTNHPTSVTSPTNLGQIIPVPVLPARVGRDADDRPVEVEPAQPAPFLLTAEEAARFLRLDNLNDPIDWLYQRRRDGSLRGTQVGRSIRYMLPELLRFLEHQTETKPR